jgi:hypothetical protein
VQLQCWFHRSSQQIGNGTRFTSVYDLRFNLNFEWNWAAESTKKDFQGDPDCHGLDAHAAC